MNNSPLNITVSGFANVRSKEPKTVNLLTWLTTDKYKRQVEAVRQAGTKEERTILKQHLPAVTPSGTFTERNQAGLIQHSGLLCLDIDGQDNKELLNFSDLKRELAKIANFAYIGLSVSGNGYYCLVPITETEKHKLHFQAICADLRQYGINVDQSGSDITRLRFASYDPLAYFNHQARPYNKTPDFVQKCNSAIVQPCKNHFHELTSKILASKTDLTGSYKAWFEIGCSLASEFGENGRSYFHQLSQFHAKYNPSETDRQFDHCKRQSGSFSINTVFHYASLHGITLK